MRSFTPYHFPAIRPSLGFPDPLWHSLTLRGTRRQSREGPGAAQNRFPPSGTPWASASICVTSRTFEALCGSSGNVQGVLVTVIYFLPLLGVRRTSLALPEPSWHLAALARSSRHPSRLFSAFWPSLGARRSSLPLSALTWHSVALCPASGASLALPGPRYTGRPYEGIVGQKGTTGT